MLLHTNLRKSRLSYLFKFLFSYLHRNKYKIFINEYLEKTIFFLPNIQPLITKISIFSLVFLNIRIWPKNQIILHLVNLINQLCSHILTKKSLFLLCFSEGLI